MMLYQCDICGEKDIIENADFVHIGDAVLCKLCYGKIVKSEAVDEVLEIIDKVTADYEALPTEIDVGREKAVISFEKKDGMLAMASIIRVLVLDLKEGDKE